MLNIDYEKTADAFRRLGYKNFDDMYSKFKGNNVFNDFEKGQIGSVEFLKYMLDAGAGNITEKDIRNAWNAMLLDFREESFLHLDKLAERHQLYLLSNTNVIHQAAFEEKFLQQMGNRPLRQWFTRAYFSNEIGLRKPDANIFEFVIADAGIKPEESLFIDDIPANTLTAKKLGFNTHVLMPEEKIENLNYDLISS